MQYRFRKNKDGHNVGEIVELDPSSWEVIYWMKKLAIEPWNGVKEIETQDPELEVQDPKPRRKRKK